MRLVWEEGALQDLEKVATWSSRQAQAVVEAMEQMARAGWSLGRQVEPGLRYWPVPPLGIFYRLEGEALIVVLVIDGRQRREPW